MISQVTDYHGASGARLEYRESLSCPDATKASFYGDYHTASGYISSSGGRPGTASHTDTYHFFPIWVEPMQAVTHGARVSVVVGPHLPIPGPKDQAWKGLTFSSPLPKTAWKKAPQRATLADIAHQRQAGEQEMKQHRRAAGLPELLQGPPRR